MDRLLHLTFRYCQFESASGGAVGSGKMNKTPLSAGAQSSAAARPFESSGAAAAGEDWGKLFLGVDGAENFYRRLEVAVQVQKQTQQLLLR